MKYTINVTEEHIKNGKRNSTRCCPIALAAKECIPKCDFVDVMTIVYTIINGESYEAKLGWVGMQTSI